MVDVEQGLGLWLGDLVLFCQNRLTSLSTPTPTAGKWLRANANPDDSIVLYDIGAVSYFSKLRTIDTWSLTDYEIARLKRLSLAARSDEERSKYSDAIKQYVLSRNPTFIVQDKGVLLNDPRPTEIQAHRRRVSSVDPVFLKHTLNPFAKCKPGIPYILELRKTRQLTLFSETALTGSLTEVVQ